MYMLIVKLDVDGHKGTSIIHDQSLDVLQNVLQGIPATVEDAEYFYHCEVHGWQPEYIGDCMKCAELIEQYEQDAYFEALDMAVHHEEV